MPTSLWEQFFGVIWLEISRMWWFFLLSILLVGLIKGYKLDLRIRKVVNRAGIFAVFIAVAVGMVSPLCACGILPVVISLAMMGTPLPPLLAILVTSPIMGPDAFVLTWRGLGLDWALLKLGGAAALGISAGLVTHWLVRQGFLAGDLLRLKPVYKEDGTLAPAADIGAASGIHVKRMQVVPRSSRCRFIFDRTLDAGLFVGKYLLLAIILEAALVTFVPVDWITVLIGRNNLFSVLLASFIGLPLPTNQITIIPILAGLLDMGIDRGAAYTLLMAGPVSSIPAIIALSGMFRLRVVMTFVVSGVSGAVLLGWGLQLWS
ncbi:MAG: permease [Desulfuromonadales bacterium]|nr:permease [Desulfuromonadales bacterium]MDT8423699.1 permease [Desulfuromonadales bacterium]